MLIKLSLRALSEMDFSPAKAEFAALLVLDCNQPLIYDAKDDQTHVKVMQGILRHGRPPHLADQRAPGSRRSAILENIRDV